MNKVEAEFRDAEIRKMATSYPVTEHFAGEVLAALGSYTFLDAVCSLSSWGVTKGQIIAVANVLAGNPESAKVGDLTVKLTLDMELAQDIIQRLDRIEAKQDELLAGGQKRQPRNMHDKPGSE